MTINIHIFASVFAGKCVARSVIPWIFLFLRGGGDCPLATRKWRPWSTYHQSGIIIKLSEVPGIVVRHVRRRGEKRKGKDGRRRRGTGREGTLNRSPPLPVLLTGIWCAWLAPVAPPLWVMLGQKIGLVFMYMLYIYIYIYIILPVLSNYYYLCHKVILRCI